MSRRSLACIVAVVLLAYWAGGADVSPTPAPSRPVLRWVISAAKNLLWAAAFFEPAPPEQSPEAIEERERVVRSSPAELGDDGFPIVNHVRGL
jgi:hypothetical protein